MKQVKGDAKGLRTYVDWVRNENALPWGSLLPKGVGTKHQRAYLLRSVRQLVTAILDFNDSDGCALGASTTQKLFYELRRFCRWMIDGGMWRFSCLTVEDLGDFVRSLGLTSLDPEAPVSIRTIQNWICLWKKMWDLRGRYQSSLRIDIYSVEEEIYALRPTREGAPWGGIDGRDAAELIFDAIGWIDEFGAFMVQVQRDAWTSFGRHVALSKIRRGLYRKHFYEDVERRPEVSRLRDRLGLEGGRTHKVLAQALSVTEGACATLILMLVGMRVSELVALNIDCLIEERTDEGRIGSYLVGIAAKRNGAPRRWVAEDPIPRVVRLLDEIGQLCRQEQGLRSLFLTRPAGSPLGLPRRPRSRMGTQEAASRMAQFVNVRFRQSRAKVVRIHPHMARKTFARLAVLRDKSMLGPVAFQLGHAHRVYTDRHYLGRDVDLGALLEREDREELARSLERLLTSERLAGKAGESIRRMKAKAMFRGKRTLQSFVRTLIDKGVQIAPCDWGYCIYSERFSACDGDVRGPNELNRSPDVCAGCHNFAVSEKFEAWWNERAQREQEFLKNSALDAQTRRIVEIRLERTTTILKGLLTAKAGSPEALT